MESIAELFSIVELFKTGGLFAGLGALVAFVIRLVRTSPIQSGLGKLSSKLLWSSWPRWVRWLIILVTSIASTMFSQVAGGLGWVEALMAAVPVAATAVAAHKGTEALGIGLHSKAVKANPSYEPSPLRKAATIIVPLDTDLLRITKGPHENASN